MEEKNNISTKDNYSWVKFYSELADALLKYKNNRSELMVLLKEIFNNANINFPFKEKGTDVYEDICPFTIFGSFNKKLTVENRKTMLREFAKSFNISADVPNKFDGIPVLMNLSAWFFAYKNNRGIKDIDNLWNLFECALAYADDPSDSTRTNFIEIYDVVLNQKMIKWNITMGLYWVRPYTFINLDSTNRNFIANQNNTGLEFSELFSIVERTGVPDGESYLRMCEEAKKMFVENNYKFHNFPELSYCAWKNANEISNESLTKIDSNVKETNYWIYSPGDNACMWETFSSEGIMAVDRFSVNCSLNEFNSKEEIKEYLKKVHNPDYTYKNNALCLWEFSHKINVGDIIFVKQGMHKIIGKGIVTSEYIFDSERESYRHIRKVDWQNIGEWEHPGKAVVKTLTNITAYSDYVQELLSLFVNEDDVTTSEEKEIEYPIYTKDDFLDEVFMDEQQYNTLVELIDAKYNVILQGAPGVGKTFAAKRLAYSIMGEKDTSRVQMIQFHQSYSYEDFIQGYRPNESGFKLESGTFYKFCKMAEADDERLYFFIIDEINRGNLSKIFGELLMLIEKDKREEKINLLYANEKFSIPKNIRIIGMMNTADRSLAMMDYALRRRFAFFDFSPAFDNDGFKQYIANKNNQKLDQLVKVTESLNNCISLDESLGDGFRIGHSYFCTEEEITDNWLKSIIEYEIIPLIKEYWFDEPTKVRDWSANLRGSIK